MTIQEEVFGEAPRRLRLQVSDGAFVKVSYTQGASLVLLEIVTVEGSTTVPVAAHLLIAVAEAVLELANDIGPIAAPESEPVPEQVPMPTMEPQFSDPDISVVTPEVPALEGLV